MKYFKICNCSEKGVKVARQPKEANFKEKKVIFDFKRTRENEK